MKKKVSTGWAIFISTILVGTICLFVWISFQFPPEISYVTHGMQFMVFLLFAVYSTWLYEVLKGNFPPKEIFLVSFGFDNKEDAQKFFEQSRQTMSPKIAREARNRFYISNVSDED